MGQGCGAGAAGSWQPPPLFPSSLALAAGLPTSKRPFPWSCGWIKQQWVLSWAAVQRAGVSSWGLSHQIHQDIPTSCTWNSLMPKNTVIFSALEADICSQGLRVFLEQRAQIFFVERDVLERVLKPSRSSCSGMEIAVQVWSEACCSLLIYLADVWWCYIIPALGAVEGSVSCGGLAMGCSPFPTFLGWEHSHFLSGAVSKLYLPQIHVLG